MRRTAVVMAVLAVVGAASAVPGAEATATLGPTKDYGKFLNILPAGQGSNLTPAQAAAFEANGTLPPHSYDQAPLYAALATSNLPALTDAKLGQYFKSERWVLPAADIVSIVEPRDDLVIARDTFGVPHVYGDTREAAVWGTGYVTASDRLFMIDVLRHIGRGRLTELLGPSEANFDYDRSTYLAACEPSTSLARGPGPNGITSPFELRGNGVHVPSVRSEQTRCARVGGGSRRRCTRWSHCPPERSC